MSAFSTIVTDVEKFFGTVETDAGKFCAAFVKLFKKAPNALQTTENFIGELAPVVEAAIALVDPVAEPLVAAGLATVETGLAGLQAAATAANSGTSFLADLQAFASTVPATLTSLAIKNPALQAKVTAIVNLITNEAKVLIPAVEVWVQQLASRTGVSA